MLYLLCSVVVMKKKKEVFAQGMCFKKVFFIFVIGCIIGVIWEGSLNCFKMIFNGLTPIFKLYKGVIYGPFSPVYGFGAVLITVFLCEKKLKNTKIFLYGSILGGVLEYMISFLQETFIGTISWDYSNRILNINGRTTLIYMAFWGLLCLIFVKYIYPFISNLIEKIPTKYGNIIFKCLFVFILFDSIISWTALYRQQERRNGIPPRTIVGKYYDIIYSDARLNKVFFNMKAE